MFWGPMEKADIRDGMTWIRVRHKRPKPTQVGGDLEEKPEVSKKPLQWRSKAGLAEDDRKPSALPLGEDVAPPPPSLEGAKPPPFPADEDIPPPPPIDGSKITKAKTEDQILRKRGDPPKRPSLIPPPLGVKLAESNIKPPTPVVDESSDSDGAPPPPPKPPKCPWTEEWDPDYKRLYYLHIDGRSQWEVPNEYWRNEA